MAASTASPAPATIFAAPEECSIDASATPRIANAMPAICAGDGLSPVAMPKITGIAAEAPAIGAITVIAPTAIPR